MIRYIRYRIRLHRRLRALLESAALFAIGFVGGGAAVSAARWVGLS